MSKGWPFGGGKYRCGPGFRLVAGVALGLFISACGAAPPIPKMQEHASCHVWTEGMMGYAAARVDDQAHLYTRFGEVDAARFVDERKLVWDAPLAKSTGTFSNGDLVIHGMFRDIGPITIEDNQAFLQDEETEVVFEYNSACSDAQASLGVMTLVVAIGNGGKGGNFTDARSHSRGPT